MGVRSCFATTTMLAFSIAPPAFAQAPPRDVIVHLKAAPGVSLEREDGDDNWVEVCFAPCDMPFSARAHYRVGGGIRDSMPFTLHETSPGVEVIVVDPRSRGVHALGDVFIGSGSAMTFGGALSIFIGAVAEYCPEGGGRGDSCGRNELLAPGLAAVFFGVGAIILGVDMVVVNNASRVHPEPRAKAHDDVSPAQNGPRMNRIEQNAHNPSCPNATSRSPRIILPQARPARF
jgi:hypothetical protein